MYEFDEWNGEDEGLAVAGRRGNDLDHPSPAGEASLCALHDDVNRPWAGAQGQATTWDAVRPSRSLPVRNTELDATASAGGEV